MIACAECGQLGGSPHLGTCSGALMHGGPGIVGIVAKRWEVEAIIWGDEQAELAALLADGWEPFAAGPAPSGCCRLFLRRRRSER